jgi:lysophospholipase L1-like esterase
MNTNKLFKVILYFIVLIIVSVTLLEITLFYSLKCPACWNVLDNKFIAQKIVRSERNVIQFIEGCSEYDKYLSYRLRPGSCNFDNIEFNTIVNVNQDGFRAISDNTINDNKDCTIAFLGDSHTMGWGVEDYETYASILTNKMQCKGYNMGVSSYGTVREILRLNESNITNLDYIVLQYSDNDLKENRSFYDNLNSLNIMSEGEYNSIRNQYLINKEYFFYKYSYVLFNSILKHFKKRYNKLSKNNSVFQMNEVDYFYNAISKLNPEFKEVKLITFELNGTNRNDNDFVNALNEKYHKKLNEEFPNITLLTVTDVLDINNYFVFDDHMNVSGHKIIANKLEELLLGGRVK